MPNDEQKIKEAVEWSKKFRANFQDGISQVIELKFADTMLLRFEDLANAYSKVSEGMPKGYAIESTIIHNHTGANCMGCISEGYNQARSLCILAAMKGVPTIKELKEYFLESEYIFNDTEEFLATSLHSFLEKKMGVR